MFSYEPRFGHFRVCCWRFGYRYRFYSTVPWADCFTGETRNLRMFFGFSFWKFIFQISFFTLLLFQIMLSIFGMVGGPLLGLFISGIFFPFINAPVSTNIQKDIIFFTHCSKHNAQRILFQNQSYYFKTKDSVY